MKRFRFRLAPVLKLRQRAEREARAQLAARAADLHAVERRIELLRGAIEHVGTDATATHAALEARYRATLKSRMVHATQEQQQCAATFAVAQQAWLSTRADRSALEKLHELRRAAWTEEQQRVEQAELEEASRRHR